MLGSMSRRSVTTWQKRILRSSRATVGCEALEHRQLLSRGMGMDALGGMEGGRHGGSPMAELGSFGGGGRGAMFGAGDVGVGGGMKDPIFLLTASLLNSGGSSTTPITKSVLSSSAVQSAFQTLQTDYNNDVSVGSKPTHASVGQLEDDLQSIRKGTLTGTAATSAIQSDEAAILTSLGLTSTQVSQLQSDLSAVQAAIQSAATAVTGSTTTDRLTTTGSTTTTTAPARRPRDASTTAAGRRTRARRPTSTAVQSAFQTLQSDLESDLSASSQPTHASVGQVQDDLDAIQKGTLTGSAAVTQVQTDTAAVLTSLGLTSSQVTQIQSDQAALATAMQTAFSQANGSTSSSTSSSASPTSIAAVNATMQSVQQYLIGLPGVWAVRWADTAVGFQATGRSSGGPWASEGGPMIARMNGRAVLRRWPAVHLSGRRPGPRRDGRAERLSDERSGPEHGRIGWPDARQRRQSGGGISEPRFGGQGMGASAASTTAAQVIARAGGRPDRTGRSSGRARSAAASLIIDRDPQLATRMLA